VTEAGKGKEKALKEKFRKFWMASVADGFKDDLEEIRKVSRIAVVAAVRKRSDVEQEPNLSTSRLSLLIDSLASGADVFSATSQPSASQVNEMELVLGST
jgi:ribosome assembly protein 3